MGFGFRVWALARAEQFRVEGWLGSQLPELQRAKQVCEKFGDSSYRCVLFRGRHEYSRRISDAGCLDPSASHHRQKDSCTQ